MLKRVEFACAALLLVGVVVLVGGASIARAMGSPIIWSIEVAQLLFLWLCVFSIDLGMQHERHFGLSILTDALPGAGKKWVQVANILVMIGLLAYLMQFAWKNVILMHPRLDGALQTPGSYFHASMVVGFALLLRTLIAKLIAVLKNSESA